MGKALLLLKKIPKGRVATYKEMARVLKTSPRAVGREMAHNKRPREYPCWKVVGSDGSLGGYSAPGGTRKKRELLSKDGILFEKGKVPSHYFHRFS